jgi:hypothetical protein
MAVVLILGLLGLADFLTRIYVPRSGTERDLAFDAPPPPGETRSLAAARQRLQSWLPDDSTAEAASNVSDGANGANDDGELPDRGGELPDRGRLAGRLYVLRGIFETDGGRLFAVLDVMPEAGGAVQQHKVLAGDDIGGVRVDRIAGRRIRLSGEGEVIELSLFLDAGIETVAVDENE